MTTMTKQTAVKTYAEAERELITAVNALDQAHAMLKDIGWDNYISTKIQGRYVTLLDAVAIADKLLFDMQNSTCPECQLLLAESEDCLSGDCPSLRGEN